MDPSKTCQVQNGARLELRHELPGYGRNKGLCAIFPDLGPVIDARRGVRTVERAHFDGITGLAPFEVVADVLLAALCRRRERCGNRTEDYGLCVTIRVSLFVGYDFGARQNRRRPPRRRVSAAETPSDRQDRVGRLAAKGRGRTGDGAEEGPACRFGLQRSGAPGGASAPSRFGTRAAVADGMVWRLSRDRVLVVDPTEHRLAANRAFWRRPERRQASIPVTSQD